MKLLKRVDEFNNEAYTYISDILVDDIGGVPDVDPGENQFLSLLDEDILAEERPFIMPRLRAENKKLTLPSNLGLEACIDGGLKGLIEKESKLREGQANDALQGVRSSLGEKSFLFRNDLRLANSKVKKTWSWTRLMAVNQKLNLHRWVYNKARKALIELGADARIQNRYKELTADHLKVSTAVVEPNASGQRDIHLAWFWNMNLGPRDATDNLLTECKPTLFARLHNLISKQFTESITCVQMQDIGDGKKSRKSLHMKWCGLRVISNQEPPRGKGTLAERVRQRPGTKLMHHDRKYFGKNWHTSHGLPLKRLTREWWLYSGRPPWVMYSGGISIAAGKSERRRAEQQAAADLCFFPSTSRD